MRDKVTFPGAKIKKKDEGMPHYDNNHEKGDLYVTFDIAFPKGELPTETKNGMNSKLRHLTVVRSRVLVGTGWHELFWSLQNLSFCQMFSFFATLWNVLRGVYYYMRLFSNSQISIRHASKHYIQVLSNHSLKCFLTRIANSGRSPTKYITTI